MPTRPSDSQPSLPSLFGRRRKREATAEMMVAASSQDVWKLVSDVGRIQEWWPRAIGGEIANGEEIGREQIVRMSWGPREGKVTQKVTQWEPGARYGWRVTSEAADGKVLPPLSDTNVTVTIIREGAVSRVTIFATFNPIGPRGALALRQVMRAAKQTYRKALKNLDEQLRGPIS